MSSVNRTQLGHYTVIAYSKSGAANASFYLDVQCSRQTQLAFTYEINTRVKEKKKKHHQLT
ncbi:hypothetical protein E2C01_032318 [Portunus trituberculatus]|uniref:Uncharacterized protein n=1 Tax=Portunus trituberculatus TaxID=210409 RepID=A0A5B7EX66_PORTR|nr:hypothetical protein [Portunus trituberculatus]